MSLGPDGRVKTMELEKIALRSGDQLSVSVTANGGGYDVGVRGASLDARGIIKGVGAGVRWQRRPTSSRSTSTSTSTSCAARTTSRFPTSPDA